MPAISRTHCIVSLLLLVICGVLCAAVDAGARSTRVAKWLDDHAQAQYAGQDRAFLRTRNYGDFFETLMLDELPRADYSRGGAYVFGSSQLVFCAEFADLPSEARKLIHNYGFPGANATEIRQFITYLEDQRGLLRAGGEKTAVLLCLSPTDMLETTAEFNGAGGYFPAYLKGSGLFDYDAARGISDTPMSAWQRNLALRRTQWRSFVHRLARSVESVQRRRADPISLRKAEEQASAAGQTVEGSQWAELNQLLDQLNARHVRTTMLIMPTGSWYKGLPVYDQFVARLPSMASARGIRLIDCSGLLTDAEFMDEHHATAAGAKKVHDVLVRWAFDELRQTGALK
jgi:hypothetical protein